MIGLIKEFKCTKENLIPALESSLLLLYATDYLAAFEVEHSHMRPEES